jgi:hypothetical protein
MDEEISAPGCPRRLEAPSASLLKIASSNIASAKSQYSAFSEAGRCLIGYFREGNTRAICLPSLSLAVRLIKVTYASELRWQREIEYGLTGPINHFRLMRKARVSGNGHELAAQRSEVLS